MIELIQFPWSPFCIVQRRILEFSGVKFKITNIPNGERSLVWRITKQRYYQVPVIRDGKSVVFEMGEDSQVIGKYLDSKLGLGLFPWDKEGVQSIVWRHIESEIEGVAFKLNDIWWKEFVEPSDQLRFLRHKERRFGRGCIEQWRQDQAAMLKELEAKLLPYEEMLVGGPYLLDHRPLFVDFCLFGMLGNFLYSGHYQLPANHTRLNAWHARMSEIQVQSLREKELHT
jgi:glutathione S-transferase